MSFFKLEDKDIISVVYTSYPTRSLTLTTSGAGAGSYSCDAYQSTIQLYDSGGMPGTGNRTYFDINGNLLTQSYYSTVKVKLYFDHTLASDEKKVIHRLRNTYFSSSFYKEFNYASSSIATSSNDTCHILSVSNILIGSGIKPKSFSLGSITDDGYGGLYSASVLVGCIFYEYGMCYFGYQAVQDTFLSGAATALLNFSATVNTPMNVYICEAPRSMLNFSLNPSYSVLSGTKYEITTEDPQTFITTVGLYDENYEMVGVAKVANPILNQETNGIQFRLKMNF